MLKHRTNRVKCENGKENQKRTQSQRETEYWEGGMGQNWLGVSSMSGQSRQTTDYVKKTQR